MQISNRMKGAFLLGCLTVGSVSARPVLQPEVKEYRALGGTFETASLPVFHQDQKQCAIAADETSSRGAKSVWDGSSCTKKGVYVAVADSEAGRQLVAAFKLDVPAKKQGYAIAAEGGRVAIVGHDPVGALYGAVTFAQMADGGTVEAARVRDWPDILYRGSVSIGRGLWNLGAGDPSTNRAAAIKAGLDLMLRHKINIFCDYFHVAVDSGEKTFAFWRDVSHYAADRGIYANDYGTTAVWQRRDAPKTLKFADWPCVKSHVAWNDHYYCWSDDKLTEDAANRYADYIEKLGAEKGILVIHPVDGGSWPDPEEWSKRCARCKARWNDHERWKASVNQFNIWTRVLRRRLPEAVIGSCIYPYTFNALTKPESERSAKWKESMPEYWQKLSAGMEDKEFFFSSWICAPFVFREFRKLVPNRPLHFSDTYPLGAGIFHAFNRKAASVWEPQSENIFSTQGVDTRAQWESLCVVSEYTWNKDAPGAEAYDGGTYYDPLVDHAGSGPVFTDALVRVCRTFWGAELAPYMLRVMSSGVMPRYILEPAYYIKYFNSVRRDPLFDPNIKKEAIVKGKLAPIVDTPEMMLGQADAAETCVKATQEALGRLGGIDRYRRKYFMYFAKYAPYWQATARATYHVRKANALVGRGENGAALELLKAGRARMESDFAFAAENRKRLAKEPDTMDFTYKWKFDIVRARQLFDRAEASAKVVMEPRKIGRYVKLGITRCLGAAGVKEYFDQFENVKAELMDSIALSELDRFDCVFVSSRPYDKDEFFANLKTYVEKGAGGVYLEGPLCGHKRWDGKSPFPEVVETAPEHVEDFEQTMKFADGRPGKIMYVDFFALKPGAKGEVRAYGPDGKRPLAVRGASGLGKVYFNGAFNLGSVGATWAEKVEKLHGANAELSKEAVEYFTGVRLKRKGE